MLAKIVPFGMSFREALRLGYVGKLECRGYLDWIKDHECDTCGAGGPCDPSHLNGLKGMGTKSADFLCIPQCRPCHERYERFGMPEEVFVNRAVMYLLEAIWKGVLVWKP